MDYDDTEKIEVTEEFLDFGEDDLAGREVISEVKDTVVIIYDGQEFFPKTPLTPKMVKFSICGRKLNERLSLPTVKRTLGVTYKRDDHSHLLPFITKKSDGKIGIVCNGSVDFIATQILCSGANNRALERYLKKADKIQHQFYEKLNRMMDKGMLEIVLRTETKGRTRVSRWRWKVVNK